MESASLEETKLTELDLPSQSLRWLVDAVWRLRLESKSEEEKATHWDSLDKLGWGTTRYRNKYVEMAASISVKETLSAWEGICKEESRQKGRRLSFGHRRNTTMTNLVKLLLSRGVTKQELGVVMESGPHVLTLSKEEWLDQPVAFLNVFNSSVLRELPSATPLEARIPTVRELLAYDWDNNNIGDRYYDPGYQERRFESDHKQSLFTVRRKLKEIGFGPADGAFMVYEDSTPQKLKRLEQSLIEKDNLTEAEAKKFAGIAFKRNWI